MDSTFLLEVYTGKGLEFSVRAQEVLVPGADGQLGFLAYHADYNGVLGAGILSVFSGEGTKTDFFAVSGGICRFANNTLYVLADTFDLKDSKDIAVINREAKELESKLEVISEFEPEWQILKDKLARLAAVRELAEMRG